MNLLDGLMYIYTTYVYIYILKYIILCIWIDFTYIVADSGVESNGPF